MCWVCVCMCGCGCGCVGVCVWSLVGLGWLVSSGDISSVDDSKYSRSESLERTPNRMGHNMNGICMGAHYNAYANCTMSMNSMTRNNSTNLNTFLQHFYLLPLIYIYICISTLAHTKPTRTHNNSVFVLSVLFFVARCFFGGKETRLIRCCGFSTPFKRFSQESFLVCLFFILLSFFLEGMSTNKSKDTRDWLDIVWVEKTAKIYLFIFWVHPKVFHTNSFLLCLARSHSVSLYLSLSVSVCVCAESGKKRTDWARRFSSNSRGETVKSQ